MCDYREYSIIVTEHKAEYNFFVPKSKLTQEQINQLIGPHAYWRSDTVSYYVPDECEWKFAIKSYNNFTGTINIKNIPELLNPSEEDNEPVAEIVIWRWNDQNQQEIIKKLLFKRGENKRDIATTNGDVNFIFRPIEKRKLVKDLCRPLDSSDAFTISVGDQKFVVSASRLMQISPVFGAMLSNEMREKTSRKVEVKDSEPEQMRAFLEVIDPDHNIRPNPTNVVGVLKLADRYQVNLAKDRCEEHLLNCVELPLIERLQLADAYKLNKLKNSILSIGAIKLQAFYKANFEDLYKKGHFSTKLLDELNLRLSNNI